MWEYLAVPLIAFGLPALLIALRWALPRIIDLLVPPDAAPEPVIELPDEKAEWDAAFLRATGKHIYPSMTPCERHHQYVIGRRECVLCGHLSTTSMPPVETGSLRAAMLQTGFSIEAAHGAAWREKYHARRKEAEMNRLIERMARDLFPE